MNNLKTVLTVAVATLPLACSSSDHFPGGELEPKCMETRRDGCLATDSENTGGEQAGSDSAGTGGAATGTGEAVTSAGGGEIVEANTGGTRASGEGSGGELPLGTGETGIVSTVAPCATNELASCSTEAGEIACHFGGSPGDYRVTVELGGDAAGDMFIDAEMSRRMLERTTTAANESRHYSFVTNVRVYEGQPVDPDQKGSSKGIPGLDVYIRGAQPELLSICKELIKPEPKIWIAGDSTVCDQGSPEFAGWGQHLPQFFKSPISVANYADSGESSGSVLGGAKLWGAIKNGWTLGDWVLIQVGHNDKTVSAATFENNVKAMITQAKAAGIHPILVTPVSRAGTKLEDQHINSTRANLPEIIRDLGTSENVPVIDLTVTTWNWLQTIDWKTYFANGTDRTHTNHEGAEVIAGFVADAIREQDIELEEFLR